MKFDEEPQNEFCVWTPFRAATETRRLRFPNDYTPRVSVYDLKSLEEVERYLEREGTPVVPGEVITAPDGGIYRRDGTDATPPVPDAAVPALPHAGEEIPGLYEVWCPLRFAEEGDPLEWPNDFGLRMTVRAESLEDAFARVRDDIGEGDYISAPGKDYRLSNGALIPEPHEMEAMPSDAPTPPQTVEEAAAHDLKTGQEMHAPGAAQAVGESPAFPSDVETGMDESDLYEVWHPDRAESDDRPLRWPNDYWADMAVRAESLEHAYSQLREWMAPGDYLAAPGGRDYCLMDDGSLRYESKEQVAQPPDDESDIYELWQPKRIAGPDDWPLEWPNDYRSEIAARAGNVEEAFSLLRERMREGDFLAAPGGTDYRLENGALTVCEPEEWVQVPSDQVPKPADSLLRPWLEYGGFLADPAEKTAEPAPTPASEAPRKMATAEDLAARWRQRVDEQTRGVKPPSAATRETIENVVTAWRSMYDAPARDEKGREPPAGKAPDRDHGR